MAQAMRKIDITHESHYAFTRGFPTKGTLQQAYDDADLNHANQSYKFFYPTVSGAAIVRGNEQIGIVLNKVFGILDAQPDQLVFTANSDTPYGPLMLDLSIGPLVVELQPGPLIVCSMDVNQRWVADMGLPGPDAGKGGKHLLLPPDYKGQVPTSGYYVHRASSNRQIIGARSLPVNGDVKAAKERLKTIKVYPLNSTPDWSEPQWLDVTGKAQDTTPVQWEDSLAFWEVLQKTVDDEPSYSGYHNYYGELAALGIEKGKPFAPDARMKRILAEAARVGNAQMRVQSFGDRRPIVSSGPTVNGNGRACASRTATSTRTIASTSKRARNGSIRRSAPRPRCSGATRRPARSIGWACVTAPATIDGGKPYTLQVPLPVPGKLFWSVTVYDAESRSQIQTSQKKAALRSLFELKDVEGRMAELHFGPIAPKANESRWIQTIPGKGWFVYFRIYGPEGAAFDGSWKPGDFEKTR